MKTLRIFLSKPETVIQLNTPWKVNSHSYMKVKSGCIFWDYNNILEDVYVMSGTTQVVFEKGYWTVKDIIKKLKPEGITCTLNNHTCGIQISVTKKLSLLNLSKYLGFLENTKIASGTSVVSPNPVNVNLGLKYINVSCSVADQESTFFNGHRDKIITSFPITSKQSLKGSVSCFNNIKSITKLDQGIYGELMFSVGANIQCEMIGEILLELEII